MSVYVGPFIECLQPSVVAAPREDGSPLVSYIDPTPLFQPSPPLAPHAGWQSPFFLAKVREPELTVLIPRGQCGRFLYVNAVEGTYEAGRHPSGEMETFTADYAVELAKLREAFGAERVAVRWGVVGWDQRGY